MSESALREEIAAYGELLTGLGLAHGSTGNISARLDDGWLISPTNSRLGRLDPARIARLDREGHHVGGDPPSKEAFLHRCVYEMRPEARAIVHLGFETLGAALVSAWCFEGNRASARVLEKAGLRLALREEDVDPKTGQPRMSLKYSIGREEWG